MPATIIPETGAGVAGANSYATREQADLYHETRIHSSAWTEAEPTTKDTALITATRHLDGSVEWIGRRITFEQSLAWPREQVEWQGFAAPRDWLPPQLVHATSELARLLIEQDLQADQSADGIAKLGLGDGAVEIGFKDGSRTRRMPLAIGELLQGIGAVIGSGGSINQRKTTR